MTERVTMPALGESVTEGTVTRWLKAVGDTIAVDEPLLEVSTDKVDTEIPSPVAGTLQEILVGEDETVPVGADLAVIGDGAAPEQSGDADQPARSAEPQSEQSEQPSTEQPSTEQPSAEQPTAQQDADQGSDAPAADEHAAQHAEQESAEQPESPQESDYSSQHAEESAPAAEPEPAAASEPAAPQSGGSAGGGMTVTMPALGESVTEGTVTRWLKAEGDHVDVDEPLLEVSTDKVDTEVPSPVAGTVQRILVGEDETVPVGAELVVIGDGAAGSGSDSAPAAPAAAAAPQAAPEPEATPEPQDSAAEAAPAPQPEPAREPEPETAPAVQASAPAPAAPDEPPAPAADQAPASTPSVPAPGPAPAADGAGLADAATYITPLVRKLAGEHGVDLAALAGTGVGGRIRKQDVLDAAKAQQAAAEAAAAQAAQASAPAAAAPAAAPAATRAPSAELSAKRGTTEKMTRLRKVIAQRMVESLQTSAQLTTVVEVDVTKIARLRDRAKRDFEAREGVKLSFLPFFALAVVEALKVHASVNASIDGDEITYHGSENLGIAVDTERGLLVPVIKDAGDLNIAGLARKIADLAERTRTNKIGPDELGGGTFTLTNTGSRGALFDTPIINMPQVAILGTGAVVRKPVVIDDVDGGETIAIRSMVYLALSYDHRLVDGADAARFLGTIKDRLEDGAFDADLGL